MDGTATEHLTRPQTVPPRWERRRPGRREHASPALIALMRKPSIEAQYGVARYDAAATVPERADPPTSVAHLARTLLAAGFCSLAWFLVIRLLMQPWS